MKKVVIDTNVFVSSFFGGNPRRVIDLWKSGKITLCISRDIVDEYIEVLARLGLVEEHDLKGLLGLFAKGFHCIFTHKTPELRVVKEDPDDDKFITKASVSPLRLLSYGFCVGKSDEYVYPVT